MCLKKQAKLGLTFLFAHDYNDTLPKGPPTPLYNQGAITNVEVLYVFVCVSVMDKCLTQGAKGDEVPLFQIHNLIISISDP